MTLSAKFKVLEKLAIDNSPALLTAVGVVGTIATAVLTHKAATKSERMLQDNLDQLIDIHGSANQIFKAGAYPDKKTKVKLVWKNYIPPVVVGGLTITSIVGSHRIGSKRAAALAAAYTLSERTFTEYREKVTQKFGESKHRQVQDEIAQDRINANPISESNVVIIGTGDAMCYDMLSGQYFRGSVEGIRKAANNVNYMILHNGYASLTEFYHEIGLAPTDLSEELGWNQDNLIDLDFSGVVGSDGQPCLAFRFQVKPIRNYSRIHP